MGILNRGVDELDGTTCWMIDFGNHPTRLDCTIDLSNSCDNVSCGWERTVRMVEGPLNIVDGGIWHPAAF